MSADLNAPPITRIAVALERIAGAMEAQVEAYAGSEMQVLREALTPEAPVEIDFYRDGQRVFRERGTDRILSLQEVEMVGGLKVKRS